MRQKPSECSQCPFSRSHEIFHRENGAIVGGIETNCAIIRREGEDCPIQIIE